MFLQASGLFMVVGGGEKVYHVHRGIGHMVVVATDTDMVGKRVVRILLECCLVYYSNHIYFQKQNLEELQEAIIAQAEIMELEGDSQGLVEAVVIESKIDPGKG